MTKSRLAAKLAALLKPARLDPESVAEPLCEQDQLPEPVAVQPSQRQLFYPDAADIIAPETVARILDEIAPYTMVHSSGIEFAIAETVRLIRDGVEGDIVECGTWQGGSSFAILLAQRAVFGSVVRPVWMLDSFSGLPAVTTRDGPLAQNWQAGAQPDKFLDNCYASEADVRETAARLGFDESEARIIPGWFSDTLPAVVSSLQARGIALLRLDGDWYESTMECLEQLEPLVRDEGTVIVDDYYAWDGCARAVHDYLSRQDLCYRIKSLYGYYGMYLVKRPHRASFEQF